MDECNKRAQRPGFGPRQTRRGFLKSTAAASVAACAAGSALPLAQAFASNKGNDTMANGESGKAITHVRSTCSPNCTGACGMVAATYDGQVKTLIQAADYGDDGYNPRGCLKGATFNTMMYGDDRLLHPMIRETSYKDGGQLRECTWDEALDFAAKRIREIMDPMGPIQLLSITRCRRSTTSTRAPLSVWST